MGTLSGRVAVVTGGSRGIGHATAAALLARGASVVIAGTDGRRLERAATRLAGPVLPMVADVRCFADVERLMQAAVDQFGGLDILVNCAGVGAFQPLAEMPLDAWARVLDTNLTGVFYGCKAAIPHLRARGGGWIINISSLSAKTPFAHGAAYCASKAALNALSDALMQEVRHDGIRVACVLPGSVRTAFGREPWPGDPPTGPDPPRAVSRDDEWKLAPEDVAEVVVDLLAHAPRSLPSRVEIRPTQPPKKA